MMNQRETEQMTQFTNRIQLATVCATNTIEQAKGVKSMGAEKLAKEAANLLSKAEDRLGRVDLTNAGIHLCSAEYKLKMAEKMIQTCQARAKAEAEIEAITAKRLAKAPRIAVLRKEIDDPRNPEGLQRIFRNELKQLLAA